ncbi:MAG: tRNA (N6-threonylcarbamoyladenosine(37)-N6)-methyltransferase TrmO [Deltaproteobacteria bacterium]|nr:tRNA (N6-threonylcarbamoyladenosine(37)-N6)-methyltransferase TrmO [Deltaproteobacteria bacterium]
MFSTIDAAWARLRPGACWAVDSVAFTPIGVFHGSYADKSEAPRQPRAGEGVPGRVELVPGRGFEDALVDLEGWDYVWVVFVFHLNAGWRPKVLPPRSATKRGVFATRSPHRPNPIGISAMRLVRVEGLTLHVADVDLLDGTPVLDIKPYVPWADAIPDARSGWLEGPGVEGERPPDPGPTWSVDFEAQAEAQLAWLEARGWSLRSRILTALAAGPHPHAYRRIKRFGERYRLGVGAFRAWFRVAGERVRVVRLESGEKAAKAREGEDPQLHAAFRARFETSDRG